MPFKFVLTVWLLFSGVAGQLPPLAEHVRAVLTAEPGVVMSIEIIQKQLDQLVVETGNFEIVDSGKCIYDSQNETILVEGNTIKTWDKQSRQLIIDATREEEFSLFELLKGDFSRLQFHNNDPGDSQLDFSIPEAGLSGTLFVKKDEAIPEKILLDYGSEQSLEIRIRSLEPIKPPGLFHSFHPEPLEVIDLRE